LSLLSTNSYEEEFATFAAQEKSGALPARPILFYGSSSFRLWDTLARDFAGLPVVNRGFGGSTLEECNAVLGHWVLPLQPRAIVLYAGDNDLDNGAEPEQVLARFEQFCSAIRTHLGWVPLVVVSIKPSPVRFWNAEKITRTNTLIREAIESRWREGQFVDIYGAMLQGDGSPRRELFGEDGLHMNPAGYALWREAIGRALAELGLQGESRVP
jgi:lysophospholipase L1-like esterase